MSESASPDGSGYTIQEILQMQIRYNCPYGILKENAELAIKHIGILESKIRDMEERSRLFFLADGSTVIAESVDHVESLRVEAARKLAKAQVTLDEVLAILERTDEPLEDLAADQARIGPANFDRVMAVMDRIDESVRRIHENTIPSDGDRTKREGTGPTGR